ncbi:MAG TPA: sugar phosphate isomerase/epimerase family protein [Burkholderiales bacterium]|jgi:sugar phosphate isomerase/epimerase|nr:sugar phosphate isomerase/epimerase family protein [Burkholderiales bacterium]
MFPLSLCNEILQPLPFAEQCKAAAALGYMGLEVAPFTLAEDPMRISDDEARGFARVAADHGIAITGLHWLLVAPSGLSMVSPDAALRRRTTEVMCRMVELCALIGGKYLVHGSPKQRSVPPGESRDATLARARECLTSAAHKAQKCGVTYCIEPLARNETDVFNTVEEAAALVDEIAIPSFKTMIDCSAAGQTEALPVHELIARWLPTGKIGHVQVNDPNRRAPGQGKLEFAPILAALKTGGYGGVLAVESFDYVPDGTGSAAYAIAYLRGVEQAMARA